METIVNCATGEVTVIATSEQLNWQAWQALRSRRNTLLSDCDWTQVSDAPVDQAAWAAYRQALRDLPETTVDPANPVWPQPPI